MSPKKRSATTDHKNPELEFAALLVADFGLFFLFFFMLLLFIFLRLPLQCFQCGGGSGPVAASEVAGARAGDAACDGRPTVRDKGPGSRCLTTRCGWSAAVADAPGSGRSVREGGVPSDCPQTCSASSFPSSSTSTRSPR